MPGLSIREWGPSVWNTLHSFAHTCPIEQDVQQQEETAEFLRLFCKRLPCPKCRDHFREFLDEHLTMDAVSSRDKLVKLLNDAHNEVNKRNGKRVYTLEEHYAVYKRPVPKAIRTSLFRTQDFVLLSVGLLIVFIVAHPRVRRRCARVLE